MHSAGSSTVKKTGAKFKVSMKLKHINKWIFFFSLMALIFLLSFCSTQVFFPWWIFELCIGFNEQMGRQNSKIAKSKEIYSSLRFYLGAELAYFFLLDQFVERVFLAENWWIMGLWLFLWTQQCNTRHICINIRVGRIFSGLINLSRYSFITSYIEVVI